jgi:hypothetical protein
MESDQRQDGSAPRPNTSKPLRTRLTGARGRNRRAPGGCARHSAAWRCRHRHPPATGTPTAAVRTNSQPARPRFRSKAHSRKAAPRPRGEWPPRDRSSRERQSLYDVIDLLGCEAVALGAVDVLAPLERRAAQPADPQDCQLPLTARYGSGEQALGHLHLTAEQRRVLDGDEETPGHPSTPRRPTSAAPRSARAAPRSTPPQGAQPCGADDRRFRLCAPRRPWTIRR